MRPLKQVMIRPVTHVLGEKKPWHDNQPCDLLHVGGRVIGSRHEVSNPPGTEWESWAPSVGFGSFDNAGKLFFWSPRYLGIGLDEAAHELLHGKGE